MSALGVDFSGSRPTPAQLKTAGVTFVMRYVGSKVHGPGRDVKWLSPSEAKAYHEAGIDVGIVFETTAKRAEGGLPAGIADATSAILEITYCGLPPGLPVYFAVDYDTTVGPNVTGYFDGVNRVLGVSRTGAYGGIKVIDALFKAGLIRYGWQTIAWSGGQWSKKAQLQQYAIDKTLAGHEVDYNRATVTDFGQWRADSDTTEEIKSEEKSMPAADLPARENVPNGYSIIEFSFEVGTVTAIGLVQDNTFVSPDDGYEAQSPARVRVTAHRKGQKGEVFKDPDKKSPTYNTSVISVGFEDVEGQGWCDKQVLKVSNPKDTDYVTVVRLDKENKRPVGVDLS
jgi:hypothetical protein